MEENRYFFLLPIHKAREILQGIWKTKINDNPVYCQFIEKPLHEKYFIDNAMGLKIIQRIEKWNFLWFFTDVYGFIEEKISDFQCQFSSAISLWKWIIANIIYTCNTQGH